MTLLKNIQMKDESKYGKNLANALQFEKECEEGSSLNSEPIIKYINFRHFAYENGQIHLFPEFDDRNMDEEICLGFCFIEMADIGKLRDEYLYTNKPPVQDLTIYQLIFDMSSFEINAEKGINSIKVRKIKDLEHIIMINNKIFKIKIKPDQLLKNDIPHEETPEVVNVLSSLA